MDQNNPSFLQPLRLSELPPIRPEYKTRTDLLHETTALESITERRNLRMALAQAALTGMFQNQTLVKKGLDWMAEHAALVADLTANELEKKGENPTGHFSGHAA